MKAPKTPNTPIKFELLRQFVGRDGHIITSGKEYFRINNLQIDQRLEGFRNTTIIPRYPFGKDEFEVSYKNNELLIYKLDLGMRIFTICIEDGLVLRKSDAEFVRDILYTCLESMNEYVKTQNFEDSTYTAIEVKDTWKMIG